MHIILTGFMGTGKTVVGKRLARRLGWRFVDVDEQIEASAKKSIARIFSGHGEAVFRRMEHRVIQRLAKTHAHVIATGGGAFVDPENRRILRAMGPVICLMASPKVVLQRVGPRMARRPLLGGLPVPSQRGTGPARRGGRAGMPGPSVLSRIQRLMRERAPAYRQADLVIDTSHLSVEEAVERTWESLSPWISRSWQYLLKHSDRLSQRYCGKYVAVLDDRVVAVGATQLKTYQRIRQEVPPTREVGIYYIPLPEESAVAL